MELKSYLRFVWRWLWLIVLLGAIAGVIGSVNVSQKTLLYASTAKLLVNQDQGRFAAPSPTLEDLRARERFSLTVMEVMQTRTVLAEVLTNLGLEQELPLGTLLSRVSTEPMPGTEVFTLEVLDTDRDRAKLLAAEIIQVFQLRERDLLDNPFAQASSLIVVEQPFASWSPVSPNIARDTILAVVIGILLALVIAFLRDYFDDSLGGGGDMERRLGTAPLAEIGTIKGATPAARLITRSDPYAPDAETYRMFRSYVDSFPSEQPLHTLVVTSPDPRAGKSITAANLAVALAQTGRRVVLVDADLRKPSLHDYFGLSNDTGLSTLLASESASVGAYLRPTGVERLRLLAAGPTSLQPAQLLGSEAFAALLGRLRAEADLIIFDTPSLLSVVDASLLVEHADATLLVARATPVGPAWLGRLLSFRHAPSTPAPLLSQAFEQLQQARASILGVLLNDVSGQRRHDLRYYSKLRRRQTPVRPRVAEGEAEGKVTAAVNHGASPLASKTGD